MQVPMGSNSKYIGFSVSIAEYRKAKKLAREQHRTVSGVMRKMLEDAFTEDDAIRRHAEVGEHLRVDDGVDGVA